ncbi:HNH endonuclease [Candidatus Uhrbacteria bacterium]|nr:MAG: HNH endonuclease [Candidatus Uhrbacteria bacterium]
MPHVYCVICKSEFYAKPRHVKRGWGKYCSRTCQYRGQHNGKHYKCTVCKTEVYRTPAAMRKSAMKKFFCGRSCLATWKNKHAPKGEWHFNWKDGHGSYRGLMKRRGLAAVCHDCGLKDERVLVVHHLDENRRNNDISNLQWLCRNCHYLAHNGKTV